MPPRPPTAADWLSLLGLTACWGTAFLFNELALEAFAVEQIVPVRIALGAVVLLAYAYFTKTALPRDWRAWVPMLVIAVFGMIVPFFLTVWAQINLPSATTAVLMSVMPLMVMSLAHYFVPGERLSRAKLAGFAIGFTGILLVMGPEAATSGSRMEMLASLAVLGAAFSYSSTSVYARLRSSAGPIANAVGMCLIATVVTAPLLAVGAPVTLEPLPLVAIIAVGVLGIFATGIASVLYFQVIAGPGPTFLSLVNYMVPVWGVLLGVVLLGERMSPWALLGLALVLAGIGTSEVGHRRLLRRQAARQHEQSTLGSV